MLGKSLFSVVLITLIVAVAPAQTSTTANSSSATEKRAVTPAQKVERSIEGGAVYFSKDQVDQVFANAGTFLKNSNYTISAGRRTTPGQAEIHGKDTDIFFVLDGSATIVTGGTIVDEKTTAPDEIRGTAINGGETTQLKKGELIVIPHGTPHWMKEVQGTFQYLVLKVR